MIELGSGFSTLVSMAALEGNGRDGRPCDYRVLDPFPGDHAPMNATKLARIEKLPATAVPLERFRSLESGDILFVDTTHTVKAAGDVNYILLEVLPLLRPGVVVQVHDVFLPWEYPRLWLQELGRNWTEQYLLQALLSSNPDFEVLFASHALARAEPERLRTSIPSFDPSELELTLAPRSFFSPGAFWFRRTGRA